MKNLLLDFFVLGFPVVILVLHRIFPDNGITPFFIPRLLANRKYPKPELRRAGTACLALAAWLFAWIYFAASSFLKLIERTPFLLGLFFFVLPILTMMALVIGMIYLLKGIFGKGEAAQSGLESFENARKEDLPQYIRKLKLYTLLNLSCPVLVTGAILVEESRGVATTGSAVLVNAALLIAFILTLWRIRFYIVKAAKAMDLPMNAYLLPTLFNPIGVFFVWTHAIALIRKFSREKKASLLH